MREERGRGPRWNLEDDKEACHRMSRTPRPTETVLIQTVLEATRARSVTLGARIQSLWSGYGEIRRVELEGGPFPSAVVKYVTPPAKASESRDPAALRSHERKLRSYEVEMAFYARYASRCGKACRVPTAHHCAKTSEGALFVLEDLDAAGYLERRGALSEAEMAQCLRWLASFHATFLGDAPEGLWKTGTYWHLATRPDELGAMRDQPLRKAAPRIDARLRAARHRTFVHGDAKLANFCFRADGAGVAAVDFQYVGGGVGVQDVAYFLDSCLTPAECEHGAAPLLDEYFTALRSALGERNLRIEPSEVEAEWRALYPFARVDFHRFLLGWAPGAYDDDAYAKRLTREVLAELSSAGPESSGRPSSTSSRFRL